MGNKLMKALELRRLLDKLLKELMVDMPDAEKMEYANIFPEYKTNTVYAIGDIFSYGVNADNEPQLYQVLTAHTSLEAWVPSVEAGLYKKIGFTADGVSIWTQPIGTVDCYQTGDRVSFEGAIYVSLIDNNAWSPTAYPQGWQLETK